MNRGSARKLSNQGAPSRDQGGVPLLTGDLEPVQGSSRLSQTRPSAHNASTDDASRPPTRLQLLGRDTRLVGPAQLGDECRVQAGSVSISERQLLGDRRDGLLAPAHPPLCRPQPQVGGHVVGIHGDRRLSLGDGSLVVTGEAQHLRHQPAVCRLERLERLRTRAPSRTASSPSPRRPFASARLARAGAWFGCRAMARRVAASWPGQSHRKSRASPSARCASGRSSSRRTACSASASARGTASADRASP